jgi:5-deoxy-glucuronate isomerase
VLKYHYESRPGYTAVVRPGVGGLRFLELGIVHLEQDAVFSSQSGDREAFLVLLAGTCTVEVGPEKWELQRASVFLERASSVYVPPSSHYQIRAAAVTEVAITLAPAASGFPPRIVRPDDISIRYEGGPTCQRYIHSIAGMDFPASRLLVGETYNLPGQWSSYPPHHHHVHGATRVYAMEQIHYYLVDPPQGFGLQRLFSDDGSVDEAHTVTNGDLVVVHGYHPVAAAPGYTLYYLWARAGKVRELSTRVHPDHAWLATMDRESPEKQSDARAKVPQ